MSRRIEHYQENEIKELLMFRKIVKVEDDTLYLDNGVELEVLPNEGCGGCVSGWYHIEELNGCDNAITNVEFECEDLGYDEYSYKIFVFAEDTRIKIVQVDGDDGNGYYGTGYTIRVRKKDSAEECKHCRRWTCIGCTYEDVEE